jgi:tRNA threonylcarbamoyladenosine biosynthesis protein TsaE
MFTAMEKIAQMSVQSTPLTLHSSAETEELGRCIGSSCRGGELVLLYGDLGAGKTVVARGVGSALGVRTWRGSPTFALIHEYATTPRLIHCDLYRLVEQEVEDLGLEEAANGETVLIVEWADRAPRYLAALGSPRTIHLYLQHGEGDTRLARLHDSAGLVGSPC